jgi:hypothetical protein
MWTFLIDIGLGILAWVIDPRRKRPRTDPSNQKRTAATPEVRGPAE